MLMVIYVFVCESWSVPLIWGTGNNPLHRALTHGMTVIQCTTTKDFLLSCLVFSQIVLIPYTSAMIITYLIGLNGCCSEGSLVRCELTVPESSVV